MNLVFGVMGSVGLLGYVLGRLEDYLVPANFVWFINSKIAYVI